MKIQVIDSQKDLKVSKKQVKLALETLLVFLKVATDEITVHFVTEKAICKKHLEFFNDGSPTDCITLPIDAPGALTPFHVLGEVFICPKTALSYTQQHGGLPYEELTLYLIHTVLHLIGYEDTSTLKKKKMRVKEKSCLEFLKNNDCILF